MLYTDRSSWSNVTGADMFVFQYMKGWPGKIVISQPLFPQDGSTLKDCAAGNYDAHWKDFGTALVSNSRADSIVRVGWEFNGDFMYWHATNDTAQFIACWNHVASAIKSTDPQALIDWTINSKATPSDSCMGDATRCYPGDQYVDYIGIDNYDEYPRRRPRRLFDMRSRRTRAASTGSTISPFSTTSASASASGAWSPAPARTAGETILRSCKTCGAGFRPTRPRVSTECLLQHPEGEVDSKIIDNTSGTCGCDNPMASAKYRQLWHP